MLLALLAGCDPCASHDDTEFVDEGDALGADGLDALRASFDAWMSWTDSGGICIDRVEVADAADDESELTVGPKWIVTVDPDAEYTERALFGALCVALDQEHDMVARAEEVLDEDHDRAAGMFQTGCEGGPPDLGWPEQVEAACGSTGLSEWDVFLADEVYPHAPGPRVDGAVGATLGDELRIPALLGENAYVMGVAPLGDAIALHTWSRDDAGVETERVVIVDPATGDTTEALAVIGDDPHALFGGSDGAVLLADGRDADTLHVIDPDGAVTTLEVDLGVYLPMARGGVSGGRLWLAPYADHGADPISVDLATGAIETIPRPEAEDPYEVLVEGFAAAPDGFVADLYVAEVEVDYDVVSIGVHEHYFARWQDGAWTRLVTDLSMDEAGMTDDGLLVGTLWGDAGEVLGAYDVAADALLVSDDLCLETLGRPGVVAGGRAWIAVAEESDVVLRPIDLAR